MLLRSLCCFTHRRQTALAIGAFATTLTTLSISLMEWRGVTTTNVYIGNFFFVAGIGMLISAQWELVKGNSFAYTVLSAFGVSSPDIPQYSSWRLTLTKVCSTLVLEPSSPQTLEFSKHTPATRRNITMHSAFGSFVCCVFRAHQVSYS